MAMKSYNNYSDLMLFMKTQEGANDKKQCNKVMGQMRTWYGKRKVFSSHCPIGTLLDMKGKTKDNHAARLDLRKMGLRKKLHPFTHERGKTYLPMACHTMSDEDKINFLKVIRDVRVPDGYASDVSRCVNLKACTIVGLKSHDNHILMQQLLPTALRGSLEKKVVKPLIELSACKLEQIFRSGFFPIMVHVVIHLVCECRLGGPVHY
jgi:hypothetical protein